MCEYQKFAYSHVCAFYLLWVALACCGLWPPCAGHNDFDRMTARLALGDGDDALAVKDREVAADCRSPGLSVRIKAECVGDQVADPIW
jgi:hypothetical protein